MVTVQVQLPFYRWPSQRRSPLVLDPYVSWALRSGEQQDLPRARRGRGWVESFIAGAGDNNYLVVLVQVDTPRVQQSLKVC